MTKVSEDNLNAFGTAVKRARSLRGWTLDELGAAVVPPVGKSLVSKIEKGRKDSLNSRTVGRFIKALDMEESWIDCFLDADTTEDSDETRAERDADRIVDRVTREDAAKGVSEDLLILLANKYAEGEYRDLETAYTGVRNALEAAEEIRKRGEMPAGNADDQLSRVMAEVAKLNDLGQLEEANDLLDAEERRMRADHEALKERMAEARRQMLEQRLNQDRLRNDPAAAAARLIADLKERQDRGKLFNAVTRLAFDWRKTGDRTGDIFGLRVSLQITRTNWNRHKGKRGLETAALFTLGQSYLRLAKRSTRPRDLDLAHNALKTARDRTSKQKEPENWAARQDGYGAVLLEMGKREKDPDRLRASVTAHRAAVEVMSGQDTAKIYWNNLGNALQALGEVTQDPGPVVEAVEALTKALSLQDKQADPLDWEGTQNNLALALRWQGALTGDRTLLDQARAGYRACEALEIRDKAAFKWATLQWNIADLALARFGLDPNPAYLDEAVTHARAAREVFAEGSDYQTRRCDDLLDKVAEARADM